MQSLPSYSFCMARGISCKNSHMKNQCKVMNCSVTSDECQQFKMDLTNASMGLKFVICAGDPSPGRFSLLTFMALQGLGSVASLATNKSVCKIYHFWQTEESFKEVYALLKEQNIYEPAKWRNEMNLAFGMYKEYPLHAYDYDLRHSLVYGVDMERFYVARAPLKLPVEVNETRCCTSSHLLFIDEKKLGENDFISLSQLENPKALELKYDTDVKDLLNACRMLNPKQESGNIVIIIKLNPYNSRMCVKLSYAIEMISEKAAVTWLIDPVATQNLPTAKGKVETWTWTLRESLALTLMLISKFRSAKATIGGLFFNITMDDIGSTGFGATVISSEKAKIHVPHADFLIRKIGQKLEDLV